MVMVKVCGITNPHDARVAVDAGADAIGLVFAPSPRQVDVRGAKQVAEVVPADVLKVGVFVDVEPDEVLHVARAVGLDYAQLHGDESAEAVTIVRGGGVKVMKAVRVRDAGSLEVLDRYEADLYLLDAYSEEARGGTGQTFDWGLAKSLRGRDNIVVSGGLRGENVGEAIRAFQPFGVDASSHLEYAPGRKDIEKVRRFVSAARG
jgi:phosphoribosylanthranilate isomerase